MKTLLAFTEMSFRFPELGNIWKPPLILHGPWGTGKTETILQTIMYLIDKHAEVQRSSNPYSVQVNKFPLQRILLATHTNSAADLCITKRLDKYITEKGFKMLRIVAPSRSVNAVPEEVLKYCKLGAKRDSFLFPTPEEILSAQVVVITTSCAVSLLRPAELYGQFTHIFLDEAAQCCEAEAIIPLVLAKPQTVIFLAGCA